MQSPLTKLAATAAAFALCVSPTMARAATAVPATPISPLIAISLYGTQASAQQVCGNAAGALAAAGAAAAAAQGQANCVLPVTDAPPPRVVEQPVGPPPPPPGGANYGINWLLAGLGLAALIGGLSTLFDDDDDAASPA